MTQQIHIGSLAGGHLGDVLCLTSLPHKLVDERGLRVSFHDSKLCRCLLENNPYISEFILDEKAKVYKWCIGVGHIIQRFETGLQLSISPMPKPEVYLSEDEISWAEKEREKWKSDKPICMVSTRAISSNEDYEDVEWKLLTDEWKKYCNIVQPVITLEKYQEDLAVLSSGHRTQWRDESEIAGAIIYKNLSVRKYLALMSVVDYFCGASSGCAHVAAAFGKPSLIVISDSFYKNLSFPNGGHFSTPIFLYPQHFYLNAASIVQGTYDLNHLEKMILTVLRDGLNASMVADLRRVKKYRKPFYKLQT